MTQGLIVTHRGSSANWAKAAMVEVYTQLRPRVLAEPCESLGIRSCCELNGNQWKSGWVGQIVAPATAPQLAGAGRAGPQQSEASKLSLLGLRTVSQESAASHYNLNFKTG